MVIHDYKVVVKLFVMTIFA